MVPALLRYLGARGHATAAAELASRLRLPAEAAALADVAVVSAVLAELVEAAAGLLGEPALALRLPAELPLRAYDVVELALRGSPTLGAGLATAARHATAIHPALACDLETPTATAALWRQRTPAHPRGLGRHLDVYGLAYVLTHARAGLRTHLAPRRVWLAHARPRALEPLERWFGTADIAFGEPDSGFELAARELAAPLHGDARLLATVVALAPAPPTAGASELAPRVAAHLRTHLAASAVEVAQALAVSARTLQRRLEHEGTTFSGIVDATREALARELLADPARALVDIAERVGFSDLATFSRAFKRWTGKPPGQFRRA